MVAGLASFFGFPRERFDAVLELASDWSTKLTPVNQSNHVKGCYFDSTIRPMIFF